MATRRTIVATGMAIMLGAIVAPAASAQALGTFRWQLQPYCNLVTLTVIQQGGVYTLDGYDDLCGAPVRASVFGTAFGNPDGTIGIGLHTILGPSGAPIQVYARINLATASGTWTDSAGNTGTFTLTPGTGTGGAVRPTFARARSGQILTGHLETRYVANSGFTLAGEGFSLPLPVGTPTPTVNYRANATPDAACPGPGQAATAGVLCIYGYNTSNIGTVSYSGVTGVNQLMGFSLDIFPTTAANTGYLLASWAYRVP